MKTIVLLSLIIACLSRLNVKEELSPNSNEEINSKNKFRNLEDSNVDVAEIDDANLNEENSDSINEVGNSDLASDENSSDISNSEETSSNISEESSTESSVETSSTESSAEVSSTESSGVTSSTESSAETSSTESSSEASSTESSAITSEDSSSETSSEVTTSSSSSSTSSEDNVDDVKELTAEEREEYYYWVKFKNSFTYDSTQLSKLARAFTPEKSGYINSNRAKGWFMYLAAALFGVSLIIYLVGRFYFDKFKGPKSHISPWYGRISMIFIFIGFALTMTFYSIVLVKSVSIK